MAPDLASDTVAIERAGLTGLPKAEVHVHLEGCFEVDHLVALAGQAGQLLPRPPENLFAFSSFDNFLDFLSWSCSLVQTPEQAHGAAYRYAQRAAQSGAVAADIIFNPTHWHSWERNLRGLVDAFDQGFTDAENDGLPPVGLCVSLLRQQTASQAVELVARLIEINSPRVVALSIDGNEALSGRTGQRFAPAFAAAGAAGLARTVHAGESSGPEGVRDALQYLKADRIDHGVRAIGDPDLVRELVDRQVPLSICPTSNITLQIFASIYAHPLEALRKAGVPISINTDDPAFLGNDLIGEYLLCAQTFGWDTETTESIAANSLSSCFMAKQRGIVAGSVSGKSFSTAETPR